MTNHMGPPPPSTDYYGYPCQAWFPLEIYGELFGTATRRAWFSVAFNPAGNADSSNPCCLYAELSRAVQQRDVGSKLISGYRASLLGTIDKRERNGSLSAQQANSFRNRISQAPVDSFRPEVWRLDLRLISNRKYGYGDIPRLKSELRQQAKKQVSIPQVLQPDEYLTGDLQADEYEVIIVG